MDVNRAHHALMFATGSFNGDITIWRTGAEGEDESDVNDPGATDEPQALGEDTGETVDNVVYDAWVTDNSPAAGDDSLDAYVIQPGLQA